MNKRILKKVRKKSAILIQQLNIYNSHAGFSGCLSWDFDKSISPHIKNEAFKEYKKKLRNVTWEERYIL